MDNIATYFAKIGFDVNKTQLDALNKTLKDVEKQLGSFLAIFDTAIAKVDKGLAKTQMAQKRDLDIKNKQAILASRNLKFEKEGLKVQQEKLKTQSLEQRLIGAKERLIRTSSAWGLGPTFSSGMRAKDRYSNAQNKLAWSYGPDRSLLESGKASYDAAIAKEADIQLNKSRKIDQQIAKDKFRAAMKDQRLQEAQNILSNRMNERKLRNVARAEKEAYQMEASWEQARIRYDRFQERYNRPARQPRTGASSSSFLSGGLIGGFARGLLPGLGAAWSVKQINDIQQEVQGQRIALQSITGSAAEGNAAYSRLRGMGNEVGFNYRDLAPRFNAILAAGKNAGISQSEGEKGFKSIMEYSSVMGLSRPQQEGAALAIEQMLSKQSVQSQELKLQLAQVWPAAEGIMARAAKATGAIKTDSVKDLLKTMETPGAVGVPTIQKFLKMIGEEANTGGALEARKKSSIAAQARFQNSWTDFSEALGKSGFDEGIIAIFESLTKSLNSGSGALKIFGVAFKFVGDVIAATLGVITQVTDSMKWWYENFPKITIALGVFGLALAAAFFPLTAITVMIGGLILLLDDMFGYLNGTYGNTLTGQALEGVKTLIENIKETIVSDISFIETRVFDMIDNIKNHIFDMEKEFSSNHPILNFLFGNIPARLRGDETPLPFNANVSAAISAKSGFDIPDYTPANLPTVRNSPVTINNNINMQIQSGSLEEVPMDFRTEIERHSREMFDQFIINHPDL